jgi:hypothetical protein
MIRGEQCIDGDIDGDTTHRLRMTAFGYAG